MVNDYLWDENEELDWGGPIIFPVSPLIAEDDGELIWFSNSRFPTHFRNDSPDFVESKRRVADRTVWALDRGSAALAIIEIDEDRSLEVLPSLVEYLVQVGVRTYVLGNEIDDPFAWSFRYKPDRVVQAFAIARDALKKAQLETANLCLPASPYLDDDGTDVLRIAGLFADIPFNSASHHYFGSVENFLPWVEKRQETLGGRGLHHFLTEVGNPAPDLYHEVPRHRDIAERYVPQILSLAVGSRFFERIFYHSLLNTARIGHSLVRIEDGVLIPEDSYRAFVIMVKLLDATSRSTIRQERDYTEVSGVRSDGIRFSVIWTTSDREVSVSVPQESTVFDVFGQPVSTRGNVVLQPQTVPYLAGVAQIVIH